MVKDADPSLPIVRSGLPGESGAVSCPPAEPVIARNPGYESRGGSAMPVYEYHCDKCEREVQLTLSIREHDKRAITCPKCDGKTLRPLLSTFVSQTSRKS